MNTSSVKCGFLYVRRLFFLIFIPFSSSKEQLATQQKQFSEKFEAMELELKTKAIEISDLMQEKVSLSAVINQSSLKIEELEKLNQILQKDLVLLQEKHQQSEIFLQNQIEKVSSYYTLLTIVPSLINLVDLRRDAR